MSLRNSLKSILIDLSGTLHIDNEITPYAIDALKRLRETKVDIKFVTNTTKESRRVLHERLVNLGFEIKPDEIFSSLWAARDLVRSENLRPMYFLDDAAIEDFKDVQRIYTFFSISSIYLKVKDNLHVPSVCLSDPTRVIQRQSNNGLEAENNLNSVVIGLAPDKFNWVELTKAFNLLLDGGKLVAIHAGRYYKRKDGLALGPGPFVRALEYAAGVEATVVGKPSATFFRAALGGVDPAQALVIGDDVKDDIGGAQNIGVRGYLVKTGKYLPNDENKINPPPFRTVDNFSEAVNDIMNTFFGDS